MCHQICATDPAFWGTACWLTAWPSVADTFGVGWVLFLCFLVFMVLDAGLVASLSAQRSAEARSPSGGSYQVRLRPIGVRWVSWSWLTGSWLSATAEWVGYVRGGRIGWTVEVTRGSARRASSMHSEEFRDWNSARRRVVTLASDIQRGLVILDSDF
jgi:hypothetical protein